MSAVDIFIVTYAEELPQLRVCLRSLRAHLHREDVGHILVSVNDDDPVQTKARILAESAHLLGDLAPRLRLLDRGDFTCPDVTGYCLQQIHKLEAARHVTTDFYVCLDSKNFLVRPTAFSDLIHEGLPCYFLDPQDSQSHRVYMRNRYMAYWGLPEPYDGALMVSMATPFVFERRLMIEMLEAVEARESMPFGEAFAQKFGSQNLYSEMLVFSAFLHRHHPDLMAADGPRRTREMAVTLWGGAVDEAGLKAFVARVRQSHDTGIAGIHRRCWGADRDRLLDVLDALITSPENAS
ncbi:MAG: DUF6492 family protein [Gemmobacter sp.]